LNKLAFNYPEGTRFECVKCGICCGDTAEKNRHILLLESEVKEISEKTGKKAADFCVEIEGSSPYGFEMRKQQDGKCVFLKNNQCTIYDFRPLICRFYPFELKFSEEQECYLFKVTLECPGVDLGKCLEEVDFKKLFALAEEKLKQSS
jgi:Fe-S-cluster containining protein